MELFYRELGAGDPLIILHGLMGSSDNWMTLAKTFGQHFHVYVPDQRNHGQSPHSDGFDYGLLTADLEAFIEQKGLKNVSLLGHSMGGKVVMKYTLQHPDQVARLVVADMAPKNYRVDYELIFTALNAVKLDQVRSRSEADQIVANHLPEFTLRQFLLKNLTRNEKGYTWRANFKAIEEHIQNMGQWDETEKAYEGPTLFISGKNSGYVKAEDTATIEKLFPNTTFEELDAGHWLHAEKPEEFMQHTVGFLTSD